MNVLLSLMEHPQDIDNVGERRIVLKKNVHAQYFFKLAWFTINGNLHSQKKYM